MTQAFVQTPGRLELRVLRRVAAFKLHDENARPGGPQFRVEPGGQGAEADADPERSFAPKGLDQGDDDLTHCKGVFTGLDVNIRDTGRTFMNKEFGQLFIASPEAGKRAVVATHAAIGTVLAAEVRYFHDAADKHLAVEFAPGGFRSALVEIDLGRTA